MMRFLTRNGTFGISAALFVATCLFFGLFLDTALAAKPEKDKTPPIITDLRVTSTTPNSAVILWTTDEPADSDIDYGIAPHLNKHGPRDSNLVTEHAIQLLGLTPASGYDFCVLSRDEANNKAEQCGTFTTPAEPPLPIDVCPNIPGVQSSVPPGYATDAGGNCVLIPPAPSTSSGGAGARMTIAYVSGFAYPGAKVTVELQRIFFGTSLKQEAIAGEDGLFAILFSKFNQGLYLLTVTATDPDGSSSAVRSYQFDFFSGDAPLMKEGVRIPPTIRVAKDTVARGDDIEVNGYAQPLQRVLVEMNGVGYETVSGKDGAYALAINSAGFIPGKIVMRARFSPYDYDFSPSIVVTLTATSIPQADLNKDGIVTIADLSAFLAHPVDMNNDGKVNAADLSIFLRAFAGIHQ